MRPIRLQSSQQNRPYKTINTASYHIVIQSTSFLYYNVAWKGGSFTFPFYPLWIVSICFTQTPPTHFIKIKWAKDLSFCHTKRRKRGTIFFFRNRPSFWMNEQKISRILFVHPLKLCNRTLLFIILVQIFQNAITYFIMLYRVIRGFFIVPVGTIV